MLPLKKDIRLVRSLHQKKFRQELGLFLAEGKKIVEEAVSSSFRVKSIYTTDSEFAETHKNAFLISSKEMDQVSLLTKAPGYLAVIEAKKLTHLPDKRIVLVLDGISDPGNMGTIIRTAEWFGVTDILCSGECVELYNPKVVQATMGSIFRINGITGQFLDKIKELREKNYRILGADLVGQNIYGEKMTLPLALVVGSESHGISPAVCELLTDKVHIPGSGDAESLNASVAAAILLSEYFRKIVINPGGTF